MQKRTRKLFMALVGAYLVYIGAQLVKSSLAGNPKNKILFIICGAVFALFGLATVIFNIIEYVKQGKQEQEEAEAEADLEEPEDGEEVLAEEEAVSDAAAEPDEEDGQDEAEDEEKE